MCGLFHCKFLAVDGALTVIKFHRIEKPFADGARMQSVGTKSWKISSDLTQALCFHVTAQHEKERAGGGTNMHTPLCSSLFTPLCPNAFFNCLSLQQAANPHLQFGPASWLWSCWLQSGHWVWSRMSRKGDVPLKQDGERTRTSPSAMVLWV